MSNSILQYRHFTKARIHISKIRHKISYFIPILVTEYSIDLFADANGNLMTILGDLHDNCYVLK